MLTNFTSFVTEKCQNLLNEYDEFYSMLSESLEAIKDNKALQKKLEDIFSEIGGDDLYDKLITGKDFEVIFRNVLSSSLVKLAQLMTDQLDSRFSEIKIKKLSIESFIQQNLRLKRGRQSPSYLFKQGGKVQDPEDDRVILHQYSSDLYDSV